MTFSLPLFADIPDFESFPPQQCVEKESVLKRNKTKFNLTKHKLKSGTIYLFLRMKRIN